MRKQLRDAPLIISHQFPTRGVEQMSRFEIFFEIETWASEDLEKRKELKDSVEKLNAAIQPPTIESRKKNFLAYLGLLLI